MNINPTESNIIPKFNLRDLMIFLVPILIFSLYIFVYNPGVLTAASFYQLHQIAVGYFTTAHPIFHSLLEALCLKIFGNPLFIGLFQILIFSVMWMAICKYHRDDSTESANLFVVQFIITLIICLIPVNAVYSVTLSSNVLFSYSLLFLAFLIKIMIDKNGQVDKKLVVLMALTIAVMSGLNNYGIVIAILTLIIITYYLLKKGNSENTYVTFIAIAVLGIFLITSLNFVYDVHKDNVGIPTNDAFNEDININAAYDQFYTTTNTQPVESYETADSANIGKGSYNLVDSFVDFWRGNFILNGLLNNPILCMIISIALLAFIYVRTESNGILFVYIPAFLNMMVAIATGQNNFYSIILTLYLVIIICVAFFFRIDLKSDNLSNGGKSLHIRERFQSQTQEGTIYDDNNYYSYLESEIKDMTLDDINEMLGETQTEETPRIVEEPKTVEPTPDNVVPQEGDDLLDQILKEIEMEKK